jgi:uncharacterized membrane protein YdfJ with MMPL/SSD domain
MELLGDRNWWLPRWLDRILPNLDVEGHAEPVEVDLADVKVTANGAAEAERQEALEASRRD